MARFNKFDVIVVPFPYTDKAQSKKRPALILSGSKEFDDLIGHSVCAMITSAKNSGWPLDSNITDLETAGLPAPSLVRMKLFTLDHRIIIGKIGKLGLKDQRAVIKSLKSLIP